jgi:thiol-disulfide isomerase/thioredoxin
MKTLMLMLCAAGILFFSVPGEGQEPASIQMYLFYSDECPSCQAILQSYVPTLKSQYPFLDIKTFEIGNPTYYEALSKLEKKFNRRGNELPVIFIGDQVLSGELEVMEKLDPLILEYQLKGTLAPSLPPIEVASASRVSEKSFSVEIVYFYQKGCPKCDRASYLLKYIGKKYPNLTITQIDLNTDDGKRLNESLSTRISLAPEKRLIAPSIFIGKDYLSPEEITESGLEALIEKYQEAGESTAVKVEQTEVKQAEEAIVERFKSFGVLAILLAGLLEGLNPCALATLVFFISYLTMIGGKRKEIFMVGIGFSVSSFLTHLLLGVGILRFIQHFSFFPLFTRVVYGTTFAISVLLGILSLYDYIQLKKGRPAKMTLQVPEFLKKKIHGIIRTRAKELDSDQERQSLRFLLVAIVIGAIVTLLQSTCTSQVYLPTLLFVTNIPSLKGSAIFYLILYNLVYILPLVAIFSIAYWGVSSDQLSLLLQRRASTIKLVTCIFFFALAGILIVALL